MMRKNTKQTRRTAARKARQQAATQRARQLLDNWLKTPEGRRAHQLRAAAIMRALLDRGGVAGIGDLHLLAEALRGVPGALPSHE
jgi:formamidopyrimidine-DNA glycosylase